MEIGYQLQVCSLHHEENRGGNFPITTYMAVGKALEVLGFWQYSGKIAFPTAYREWNKIFVSESSNIFFTIPCKI